MNTHPDDAEPYKVSGLDPEDAARLIEALERAVIEFEVEVHQELPSIDLEGDSAPTRITIAIDAHSEDAVRRIESELFNDPLL